MHYDEQRKKELNKPWLMQGDCLERMKEIPDGSVDMILTDPPYGTTACKWDSIIPLEPMWEQLKRIIKPNGAIVMTASQPFTTTLIASNMKMFKYCWVWEKDKPTNFALANKQPMKYHEDIVVFYLKQPSYNKQMIERSLGGAKRCKYPVDHSNRVQQGKTKELSLKGAISSYDETYKNPSTILRYSTGRRQDNKHPTQKPVALMEYLIKTYTNEGETVLDFTAGSFTTGVACVNLNRKFIGIEMDKNYFDIGVNRIKERIKCLDLKIEPMISMGD